VSGAVQLLVLIAVLVVFWAIVMRPARRQQRTVAQLQQELAVGDEVIISAGIFGVVRSIDDGKVDLEIAPGTVITVARQVVVRRAPEEQPEEKPAEPEARPTGEPAAGTTAENESE
jgi:preprotein translocase subunit YajC